MMYVVDVNTSLYSLVVALRVAGSLKMARVLALCCSRATTRTTGQRQQRGQRPTTLEGCCDAMLGHERLTSRAAAADNQHPPAPAVRTAYAAKVSTWLTTRPA